MHLTTRLALFVARRTPPRAARRISWLQFHVPGLMKLIRKVNVDLADELVAIDAGAGAGLLIAAGDTNLGYRLGTTEPDLQAFIAGELSPGDTFYDAGANVGFFTLIGARRVGKQGHVLAFEPARSTAGRLKRNVEANGLLQVEVVEAALGGQVGRSMLTSGGSSLEARLGTGGENDEEVDVLTIDHGVQQLGWPPPSLIKLDIEGAEVAALHGLTHTARRWAPTLLIEVHWCKAEVLRELNQLGYSAASFGDVDLLNIEGEAHGHLLARPHATDG